MNMRKTRKRERRDPDIKHHVRALSHDINANFMVLEHSFRQLKQDVDNQEIPNLAADAAHVEACLRESRRLLSDLAMLAKTGAVEMDATEVVLSEVVSEVVYEQEDLLAERNILVNVARELPTVLCNQNRVKQIFTNLIRNAAKHGCRDRDGRITISHRLDGELPSMATIVVHDNGPGIPAEMREMIFEAGQRLTNSDPDGTGMGLAIVKKIVDHYGGSIYVDPSCPDGTAFVFSLPIAADSSL